MGNILTEFQTQGAISQENEVNRIDGTVITREHQYLTPVPPPASFNLSSSDMLRTTLPAKIFQISTVPSENKSPNLTPEHTMPLDLAFYHSLCLPSYSFKGNTNNAKITEQIDRFGVKYVGEWDSGRPEGNGVLTSNLSKYIGTFKKGMKHVHGREIYAQEVYEGGFDSDLREGVGIRFSPDQIEEGIFNKGYFVNGTIKYRNKNIFKGTVLNSRPHGKDCYFYDAATSTQYKNVQFDNGIMVTKVTLDLNKVDSLTEISSLPPQWK